MSKISAAITAVGAYVPEYVLTNQILETMVDTNDEWITSRTGIKERRILKDEGKGTSYLAIKAAQNLIDKKGIGSYEDMKPELQQKIENEFNQEVEL